MHRWNVQTDLKQRGCRFCSPVQPGWQPNRCMSPNHQDSASVVLACCLQGSHCTQYVFTLTESIALSISLSKPTAISCPPHLLNLSIIFHDSHHHHRRRPTIFSHSLILTHTHSHTDTRIFAFSDCCRCNDHISCWTAVKQLLLLLPTN